MQDRGEVVLCPFCGSQTDNLSKSQVTLLRAALMSDIVPALLHDARRVMAALSMNHSVIQLELKRDERNDRLQKTFKQEGQNLTHLNQFFDTLRNLFRAPDDDTILNLRDLPGQIQWLWSVFDIQNFPDVSVLKQSDRRIRYASYWDTLILAVHAALISLRRDRNPTLDVSFRLNNEQLVSAIEMSYNNAVDTTSPQWDSFRSVVKHAGGSSRWSTSGHRTVMEWNIPLV